MLQDISVNLVCNHNIPFSIERGALWSVYLTGTHAYDFLCFDASIFMIFLMRLERNRDIISHKCIFENKFSKTTAPPLKQKMFIAPDLLYKGIRDK